MISRNRLLAVVDFSYSYKEKDIVVYGSDAVYHVASWRMDHVANSGMRENNECYWSILKLSGILKRMMNCHPRWEAMLSDSECRNSATGTRLVRRAILTARVMVAGEVWKLFGSRRRSLGVRIIVSVRSTELLRSTVVSITFTWEGVMGGARFDQALLLLQGMSETFETLHNLVHKGVKVVMDIPYELWNETSAEVADLKKQVPGSVGLTLGSHRWP